MMGLFRHNAGTRPELIQWWVKALHLQNQLPFLVAMEKKQASRKTGPEFERINWNGTPILSPIPGVHLKYFSRK